ncbi:hypothetical protein N7489_008680 [Penicillium chrysogenum]|uniref:uncharacterized protein n=1 Tax=Penicillium chrysogenum TaxID=5076 RepID=UPI0024DF25AE|nr:uncharacterized protein N7489_008680 [Penicillium chrysogenum]KAJ5227972.1 hypothetical protein N7489_008680 [Penicillium chrysogenum]
MPTPEDTNETERNTTPNQEPSTEPMSGTRESTQHQADNTPRDTTRRTEIYTDNPDHASRLTDEERQRLEALAADSGVVRYSLHTLMADGTRRTDQALMQYLFQDDIWEAIDTSDIRDRETRGDGRNGHGNGRQGDESELKLLNGTEESHEEELKRQRDG